MEITGQRVASIILAICVIIIAVYVIIMVNSSDDDHLSENERTAKSFTFTTVSIVFTILAGILLVKEVGDMFNWSGIMRRTLPA